MPLDFDFFKRPVYPYGLKENLTVRVELNSSEKVILFNGDTTATYKLSDISLEYDTKFNTPYATAISELYAETKLIRYTKVTSDHYQTLSKKDTTWKIDVTCLFVHYKSCCYYFLINAMTLRTKIKNFATLVSRKF